MMSETRRSHPDPENRYLAIAADGSVITKGAAILPNLGWDGFKLRAREDQAGREDRQIQALLRRRDEGPELSAEPMDEQEYSPPGGWRQHLGQASKGGQRQA